MSCFFIIIFYQSLAYVLQGLGLKGHEGGLSGELGGRWVKRLGTREGFLSSFKISSYIRLKSSVKRKYGSVTYLRIATVMASGEVAQGQITSGFSPWDWNTFRKASQEDTDPGTKGEDAWKSASVSGFGILHPVSAVWKEPVLQNDKGHVKYSQGLAPSATISIRNDAKLVSLCSRWAIMAQCRSRHFTKAKRAAQQ